MSIFLWAKIRQTFETGIGARLVQKGDGTGTEAAHTWMLANNSSTVWTPRVRLKRNGNTDTFNASSTGDTLPTGWHHSGFTYDGGANSGITYHDGASHHTWSHTETTGNIEQDSKTVRLMGAEGDPDAIDAIMSWVGIWDVALSADEVAALASGILPIYIRPDKLLACYPLWGVQSPEIDLTSNARSVTLTGTTRGATDAPVEPFLISSRVFEEVVAAPAGIIPLIMHHRKLLGV